jgi:hypothetical protein
MLKNIAFAAGWVNNIFQNYIFRRAFRNRKIITLALVVALCVANTPSCAVSSGVGLIFQFFRRGVLTQIPRRNNFDWKFREHII